MKLSFYSTDWSFTKAATPDEPDRMTANYGGTYFYRMALPAMGLQEFGGHECLLSFALAEGPDGHIRVMDVTGEWHDDVDVVVFQRWMHEDGVARAQKGRACGQIVINDVDDHFWALPRTNVAHSLTDPRNNAQFNRDHYRKMLSASSGVICSTQTIASFVERQGAPTFIARNSIAIDAWPVHDTSELHIGWTGGIAWRANDLPLLRGVLGPFLEENGLDFYHGGESQDQAHAKFPKAPDQLQLPPTVPYSSSPIVHISKYPGIWDPITCCVIPLENCTFNHAKSFLKSLEASACGIPYIASDLPEQRLFVEDGGAGRLAKKPWQWRQHLDELLDPNVRAAEGAANRAHAEQWDISRKWTQWQAVLDELVRDQVAA